MVIFFTSQLFSSVSMRSKLREAGCVKLGHLMKTCVTRLSELLNIHSQRLVLNLVKEICVSLPGSFRTFVGNHILSNQWDDEYEYVFHSLTVSPAVESWQDGTDKFLSYRTPILGPFEDLKKNNLYFVTVKVLNLCTLHYVRVSRWTGFFGSSSVPRGCWRSLYKPPLRNGWVTSSGGLYTGP